MWNQVFAGVEGAPAQSFPDPPYTTLETTPVSREKPYLYVDDSGRWNVLVPAAQRDSRGTTWQDGPTAGRSIPLRDFYLVVLASEGGADRRHIAPKVTVRAKLGVDLTFWGEVADSLLRAGGSSVDELVRDAIGALERAVNSSAYLEPVGEYLTEAFVQLARRTHKFHALEVSGSDFVVVHYDPAAAPGDPDGILDDNPRPAEGIKEALPPRPARSAQFLAGLEHLAEVDTIVVLMQENRSFDHMLGYLSLRRHDALVRRHLVCDRWFAAFPGATQPNRFCTLTGSTPVLDNFPVPHPALGYLRQQTVFDRLTEAGIEWCYYEHGGFFDHVPPPGTAAAPAVVPRVHRSGPRSLGVRVPTFVVSPMVPAGGVSHLRFDHTSIAWTILLRFLGSAARPMSERMARSNHLGMLLDPSLRKKTEPIGPGPQPQRPPGQKVPPGGSLPLLNRPDLSRDFHEAVRRFGRPIIRT